LNLEKNPVHQTEQKGLNLEKNPVHQTEPKSIEFRKESGTPN